MSFTIIVYIIICIIAVIVFLLHESEKGGMGIIGGYSNTLLGTSRVSFIGRIATIFAVLFFFSALFLAILSSGNKSILRNLETTEVPTLPTEEVENAEVKVEDIEEDGGQGSSEEPSPNSSATE